jgi:sugar lactone lactonase YvrE
VTNDEGGIMAFFDPAGGASWSFDYVATSPPFSYVVFDSGGTLYASEADPAPDDIRRVVAMHPGEQLEHFVSADFPSGLALRADGALLVSETAAGRITLVNPDGSTDVVAEGLAFPEALALDADGSIYAVTGPAGFTPRESTPVPFTGDTIIRITQEGEVATVARLQDVVALAVGPGGDLFATVAGTVLSGREGSQVVRISSDGTQTLVASGLRDAIGLAFDLAGSLYVADWTANGIVRIGGFPQGTLSGVVTDASGAPIEGACVHVLAVAPIVVGQVVFTDAEGRFTLPAAPRTYSLTVTYDDATITLQDVAVSADEETALEIAL